MGTQIFQLDSFTARRFHGNPAAVIPLDAFLADAMLQQIAAENNLSETAFIVADDGDYRLRWFTPTVEVPLCGHATLASAAVVFERLQRERERVVFHTASGPLTVTRKGTGYVMDSPKRVARPIDVPHGFVEALGAAPLEVLANHENYLAVFESARVVRELAPDFVAVARLERQGVCVTARGDAPYDFVSRYFAPAAGIAEDPVTGSAHCMLAPYWSAELGKTELHALQASRRTGELICRVRGERVELEGTCVFYLEGVVEI